MKVPLSWLSDYVDLPESIEDLAYRLIMTGTEVDSIVTPSKDWQDVFIARVTSLEKPKGSERVQKAMLDIGEHTIVAMTAAPNIAVGQRVPFVRVPGVVPRGPEGEPYVLQPKPMFGITGEAMILSERELGLSEAHAGILVLPEDAPLGKPLSLLMGQAVLDVAVQANRGDQMSLLGIAREVAAATNVALREPALDEPRNVQHVDEPSAQVEVMDFGLCQRYAALRISGVTVGDSPAWLSARVEAAGLRSINNIVDATNFVMLELGQPLHAFDYDRLAGGHIIVRQAYSDEHLETLDRVDRQIPEGALLITDEQGPVAIAGVMGGSETEVSGNTKTILLESATFSGPSIRRTSRTLGLRSEASARFERGVPPELADIALKRCLHLIASTNESQLEVASHVDAHRLLEGREVIQVPRSEFGRLLGIDVQLADAAETLTKLGFSVEIRNDAVLVRPPFWRPDVEGPADVAEEVARSIGYDRIPETLPIQQTEPVGLPSDLQHERVIRQTLRGLGLSETWNDTLTSPQALARLFGESLGNGGQQSEAGLDWNRVVANPNGVRENGADAHLLALVNPQTVDRSVLRLTLVPSLLDVIARNLKHTRSGLAFFELARTFFPKRDDLPYERRTLAMAVAGSRLPRSWKVEPRDYDFFDLKGILSQVLQTFRIEAGKSSGWRVEPFPEGKQHPALHPGRSGEIHLRDSVIGFLGELHPTVAEGFEISAPIRALVAELDLDSVVLRAGPQPSFRPIARYPVVRRDISMIFPEDLEAERIEVAVREVGGELLKDMRIVDVFHGGALEPGKKSIAMSIEFQSDSATLTQSEISALQDAIINALEQTFGGELRG